MNRERSSGQRRPAHSDSMVMFAALAPTMTIACGLWSSTLDEARAAQAAGKDDEARLLFKKALDEATASGDAEAIEEAQVASLSFVQTTLDAKDLGAVKAWYAAAVSHELLRDEAEAWLTTNVPGVYVCDSVGRDSLIPLDWEHAYSALDACAAVRSWMCASGCATDAPGYLPAGERAEAHIASVNVIFERLQPQTGVGHPLEMVTGYLSASHDAGATGDPEAVPWPDGKTHQVRKTMFTVTEDRAKYRKDAYIVYSEADTGTVIGVQALESTLLGRGEADGPARTSEPLQFRVSRFVEWAAGTTRTEADAAGVWLAEDRDAFATALVKGTAMQRFDNGRWALVVQILPSGGVSLMVTG